MTHFNVINVYLKHRFFFFECETSSKLFIFEDFHNGQDWEKKNVPRKKKVGLCAFC